MLFVLLAVVLVLLLLLGRGLFSVADAKRLLPQLRKAGGFLAIALAVIFAITGREALAIVLLTIAAPLLHQFWSGLPGAGTAGESSPGGQTPPRAGAMTMDEAYRVLGLPPGASRADIQRAHHDAIKRNHPDHGGSNYLAAKINEAKDVLLRGAG